MQLHHHDHLPGHRCISPAQRTVDLPTPTADVSRHLACLKTRLNFACFKLNNGWETNTLIDVELMWKKRQRKLYSEIPTPRFTQQDILDKRGQFSSAKLKKARLCRTYSAPQTPSQYRKRKLERQQVDLPPTHHHHHDYHPTTTTTIASPDTFLTSSMPLSSLDTNQAPPVKSSLDYLSYAIEMTEGHQQQGVPPPAPPAPPAGEQGNEVMIMSNSQPQPDISRIEPNLYDDEEEDGAVGMEECEDDSASQERSTLRSSWRNCKRSASFQHDERPMFNVRPYSSAETESDDQPSPPSSPVTAAAHAIMMFVNDHYVPTDSTTPTTSSTTSTAITSISTSTSTSTTPSGNIGKKPLYN